MINAAVDAGWRFSGAELWKVDGKISFQLSEQDAAELGDRAAQLQERLEQQGLYGIAVTAGLDSSGNPEFRLERQTFGAQPHVERMREMLRSKGVSFRVEGPNTYLPLTPTGGFIRAEPSK